jgi:short-subunit dehydrogenase
LPETALITGASSGIGRELASVIAKDRIDLVLVARRRERLDELATEISRKYAVTVEVVVADLSRAGEAERVFQAARARSGAIDVLVNNAGVGVHGLFADTALSREVEMIQINVIALTELTKHCVPGMIERRHGRIVNVASTAAFQPGPLMAVYYATKAHVLSFTEALAEELSGTGVTATALCPGPTRTEFQQRAGFGDVPLLRGPLVWDAARVARVGWEGAKRGKRVVVPGLANRVLALGARLSPRRLTTKIARRLQENRKVPE